jgi:hypothetical protein
MGSWSIAADISTMLCRTSRSTSASQSGQHHDVDEVGGKAGLVHRGLRGAARGPARLYRAADGSVRAARDHRHLVCPRLGRLPACAPGAQPQARQGCQGDARDRRGSLRHGARVQGIALGRAWRRAGALGVPRGDVRGAHGRHLHRGQGPVRPEGHAQSGQDRAAVEDGRPLAASLSARLWRGRDGDRPRLAGVFRRRRRFPGRGRDVQQQRRLPEVRRGRHVPVLPGDRQRARPDARASEFPPTGDLRATGRRCAHVRRNGRDHGPVRVVQGVPAGMPHRASTWRA